MDKIRQKCNKPLSPFSVLIIMDVDEFDMQNPMLQCNKSNKDIQRNNID